jgi:hypothetical protein
MKGGDACDYTHPVDVKALRAEFDRIMRESQPEFDWLYGTSINGRKATILYTIWSDVASCFRCAKSFVLWDQATDRERGEVPPEISCPECKVIARKSKFRRIDSVPVRTYVEIDSDTRRRRKRGKRVEYFTTREESDLIRDIKTKEIPYWYPTDPFEEVTPKSVETQVRQRILLGDLTHRAAARAEKEEASWRSRSRPPQSRKQAVPGST